MITRHGIVLLLLLPIGTGCGEGTDPTAFRFTADTLAASVIQVNGDSAGTYEYDAATTTNPDSVLRRLWKAGFSLREAWFPLDNLCMDPLGARLTIRLAGPDPRITRFGFAPGNGRLACATQVKHYRFESPGT